jgi:hypothetical protein
MATEESKAVIMLPFSPAFVQLSDIDRLRALDRIILATRARLVLSKAYKLSPTERLDISQQETLLTTYLQLGSLERRPAEQLLQVIFSLAKGQPRPAFPSEMLKQGETLSFERAVEVAPVGCKEVLERVLQFAEEAVRKEWVDTNFIVEVLTDAMLNYKTTRKVFNRFSEFLKSTLSP